MAVVNQTKSPGTGTVEIRSGSTYGWGLTAGNIVSSNNVYATFSLSNDQQFDDSVVSLGLFGGVGIVGLNKADGTDYPVSDTIMTYTDTADATPLWETGFVNSQINDSSFAVYLSCRNTSFGQYSDYLVGHNYGFTLPDNSTPTSIEVKIERARNYASRSNVTTVNVDHFQVVVQFKELVYPNIRMFSVPAALAGLGYFIENGLLWRMGKQSRTANNYV